MIVRDPIIELKETALWKYLDRIDNHLSAQTIVFVEQIAPLLKSIQVYFPYYTRHDAHHGFRVLNRMSQIIYAECLNDKRAIRFTNIETFLLICSAYAHDLGMAIFPGEEDELLNFLTIEKTSDWKTNYKLQRYLRDNHSARGGKYIDDHYSQIGVPKSLVSHLNLLMVAHNLSTNDLEVQLSYRSAGGEKELNLKQLACILCIADSLEFSESRVVDGVLESLQEKITNQNDTEAFISYKENMKHVCIGDNVAIGKKDGRIMVSGTFTDPDVLNLAHKTFDFIESWIRNYVDIDFKSSLKRLKVTAEPVIRTLNILKYDFVRLGIRIKKENIINLISSNSTWSNDGAVVLRELLQNSVEACRYRQFNSSTADAYTPSISVIANDAENTITIIDNGCGMSRNTILTNFLTVGNSRSFDPTYKSSNFKSLARFGIGFWSTFTIATKAIIDTAPYEYLHNVQMQKSNGQVEGLLFDVSIDEFKDYTTFETIDRLPGTKIILLLREDISIDNLLQQLNRLILCSEIPINITKSEDSYSIPRETSLPSFAELTGSKRIVADKNGVQEFVFHKPYKEFDFKLKILYRLDNGKSTFQLSDKHQNIIHVLDSLMFGVTRLSFCGFFTAFSVTNLIFDLNRVGVMIANVIDPGDYSFNLNRFTLLPSKSTEDLHDAIKEAIHEGYSCFLKKTNSFDKKSIYELNQQSRSNGGNIYDQYTKNHLYKCHLQIPHLLSFKLIKLQKNTTLENAKVRYEFFDELKASKFEMWSMTTHFILQNTPVSPDQQKHWMFQVLTTLIPKEADVYYLEPNNEVSLLFDNDPNSYVQILSLPQLNNIKLPLLKIFSNSVYPYETHEWFICDIRGVWSGVILEKKVFGANYAFIGRHKLIVKPDSLISQRVKELFNKGATMKLCSLIKLLYEASEGLVDDAVKEFL